MNAPSPTLVILAALGLTIAAPPGLGDRWAHGAVSPVVYDLRPFSLSAPELDAARRASGADDPTQRAALEALKPRIDAPGDPHTRATALWLATTLDPTTAPPPEAAAPGALDGMLHVELASAALAAGDRSLAARELLAIPSSIADHGVAWLRGVELLVEEGQAREALTLLSGHLRQPMASSTERQLIYTASELAFSVGDAEEGRRLLEHLWWRTDRAKTRQEVEARLVAHEAKLSPALQFARPLLDVRSGRRSAEERRLLKLRKARKSDKALVDWGLNLLRRLSSKERAGAIEGMLRLESKMRGDVRRPLWHLGAAMVLRRSNRDLEAAMHYAALAAGWPDHPAANRARVEAGWLLSRKGLPAEAAALWSEAAADTGRSDAQRDALWWGGFAALLAGEGERAHTALVRLATEYGDERDGIVITWESRATYWQARNHELQANIPEAFAAYAQVILRTPMSWYALLAEARLARLVPLYPDAWSTLELGDHQRLRMGLRPSASTPELGALSVPRHPSLDLAVAYVRLGSEDLAITALEHLLATRQITGGGRALLSVLYQRASKPTAVERVLRHGSIMSAEISPKLAEMYTKRHRLDFEEILVTECLSRGVSVPLFAGLVHVESRFRAKATSQPGAVGLAQIMPSTAKSLAEPLLGKKVSRRALRKVDVNLALGVALLGALLEHFRGNPALALAAYNAGRGAVRGWLRTRGHLPTDAFVESIPYGQARRYVMRVMASAHVYDALYQFEGDPPVAPLDLPLTLGPFAAEASSR